VPTARRRRRQRWFVLAALAIVLAAAGVWGGRQLWARHYLRQGQAALEREDFAQALGDYDRCLRVWPDAFEAHLGAARAARRGDDLSRAEDHLRVCQRLNAASAELALEAALLQAQRGGVTGPIGPFAAYLYRDCPERILVQEA